MCRDMCFLSAKWLQYTVTAAFDVSLTRFDKSYLANVVSWCMYMLCQFSDNEEKVHRHLFLF